MPDDFPLGRALPPAQLDLRRHLPGKPAPVILEGSRVMLRPTDAPGDAAALHAASDGRALTIGGLSTGAYDADRLVWRYMPGGPFPDVAAMQASLQAQVDAPDATPLTVVHRASGASVGLVNLMSNDPANLKIELGGIWYSPIVQRTGANTEATWLLLRHVFGLGYRRAEWKCDSLNARSRRAALRMGFRFEGIQEQHRITKGRNRDTAWFRIVAEEWPAVDLHLQTLLAAPDGRDTPPSGAS